MSNKEKYLSSAIVQQSVPVFFQAWWLDIVCQDWDVAIVEEDGEIIAVFPYQIERKLGIKLMRNPLLAPYLGPYILKSNQASDILVLGELWAQIPRWDNFDALTTTDFKELDFFSKLGFEVDELSTYCLNLKQQEEDIFKAIHSNHKNLIRQASKLYQVSDDAKNEERLLALHEATFSRKDKKYVFDVAQIKLLVKACYNKKQGKILAASLDGQEAVATIFVVWDNKQMYLLLSAMDAKTAHPGAIRFLIWESIKMAKNLGLSIFDFEGSMDTGIAAFFRRFGSEKKSYFQLSKTTSSIWKLKKALLG